MTANTIICDVCKAPMDEELTDFTVDIEGEQLLLEDVPVWVCPQCDSVIVENEVIEAVEEMLAHLDEVVADAPESSAAGASSSGP